MTWYGMVWDGLAWHCVGRSCIMGWRRGDAVHHCNPLDDRIRIRIRGCCLRHCGSFFAGTSSFPRLLPVAFLACQPWNTLVRIFLDPIQPQAVLRPNDSAEMKPRFRHEAELDGGYLLWRLQLVHVVLVNLPCGMVPFLYFEPELDDRSFLHGGETRIGPTPDVCTFRHKIRLRSLTLRCLTSSPHGCDGQVHGYGELFVNYSSTPNCFLLRSNLRNRLSLN